MNFEWLGHIVSFVKEKATNENVFPLSLITSGMLVLLLFGPEWLLVGLGLRSLIDTHRGYFGLSFAICAVVCLFTLSRLFSKNVIQPNMLRYKKKKYLLRLTPCEKSLLVKYISNDTRSQSFYMFDGVISGLIRQGLLYNAIGGYMTDPYDRSTVYNIDLYTFEYLKRNPQLLQEQ